MSDYVDLATLGQLLLASLAGGVGLVALFALAVRAWSRAADEHRTDGTIVAVVSLAGVVAGVLAGLYVLLSA
jgi:hypothetical protein